MIFEMLYPNIEIIRRKSAKGGILLSRILKGSLDVSHNSVKFCELTMANRPPARKTLVISLSAFGRQAKRWKQLKQRIASTLAFLMGILRTEAWAKSVR